MSRSTVIVLAAALPLLQPGGASEGARGFVGIAFRLQDDNRTYDAFYLRPTIERPSSSPAAAAMRTQASHITHLPGSYTTSGCDASRSNRRLWPRKR